MKLHDLIKSHNWLSVEFTLLKLFPDQTEIIDNYKTIFEKLQLVEPVNDEMLIVLTEYESDTDKINVPKSTYVDVAGRKLKQDPNSLSNSYAIEFVKWENWLGMEIAPETLENFNVLEIIAHCLYEMTFCGYEQDEIQGQFDTMNKTIVEYKTLTNEQKKGQTISLDDLKKKLDEKGGS